MTKHITVDPDGSHLIRRDDDATLSVSGNDPERDPKIRAFVVTLGQAKAEALARLAAHRYERETAGIVINGVAIQTDRDSQALIDALQRSLADGIVSSVAFKTAAGQIVNADISTATAIRNAVVLHVQACRSKEAEHAQAVAALTSIASVDAYDVTTGWPA